MTGEAEAYEDEDAPEGDRTHNAHEYKSSARRSRRKSDYSKSTESRKVLTHIDFNAM